MGDLGLMQQRHLMPDVGECRVGQGPDVGVGQGASGRELLDQDAFSLRAGSGGDDMRCSYTGPFGEQGQVRLVFVLLFRGDEWRLILDVAVAHAAVELVEPVGVALLAAGHLDEQLLPLDGGCLQRHRTAGVTRHRRQPRERVAAAVEHALDDGERPRRGSRR